MKSANEDGYYQQAADVLLSSSNGLDIAPSFLSLTLIMSAFEWVVPVLFVCGGVVPYVPQYLEIKRSKNVEGFSTYVCLTLLIANTLRILFWFGHPFELPLLVQSVVMNAAMLAMVHICVETRNSQSGDFFGPKHKKFKDFDFDNFWQWTDFFSYVQFLMLFALSAAGITYAFSGYSVFVEALGFSAVLIEAMLGMPQFYHNLQNKSTEGMSVKMVILWTLGDVFKTLYFIIRDAPFQFWVCGMLQVTLDIAILGQVLVYNS